jgi:hypothetical protein
MPRHEIPRDEWVAWFDSFSRQHAGWLVTVEVLGRTIGAQIEALAQPLMGITMEVSERQEDVMSVLVGGKSDKHLAHLVHAPVRVLLQETAAGAHEAVYIEAEDGLTTVVRFRSPMLSELVDGVVLDR